MRRFAQALALAVSCQLSAVGLAWGQVKDETPFLPGSSNVTVMGCADTADTMTAGGAGAVKCGTDREPDIDISGVTPSGGRLPVDGSGVTQPVSGPLTDAQLRASAVPVDSELPAAAALGDATANPSIPAIAGYCLLFNGTTWDRCRGDTTNGLDVDVTRIGGAVDTELPTVETPADNLANGTAAPRVNALTYGFDGTAWDRLPGDSTNGLRVDLGANNDVTLTSGTLTSITNSVTVNQATAANLNAEVQGDAAHGAAVSGNPLLMGGEARTSNGTAVTNGQAVRAQYDVIGRQVVFPYTLPENIITGCATSTGTGDTALLAAAGAGVRNNVSSISVINMSSTGTYITIKDGATAKYEVAAPASTASIGGAVPPLPVPIRGTANTAINFASAVGVTTMRVCVIGFTSP